MKTQISILFFILGVVLTPFPCVVTANVSDGLVAYYPLDGNAMDASGNGNDGQVLEPVPYEDFLGNTAGAMYFDGGSSHNINIGNRVKPPFPFTISAWIKPDNIETNWIISLDNGSSCPGHYYGASLTIRSGRITANYNDGGYCAPWSRKHLSSDPVVVADVWQHVTVVFRSHLDILIYRNGIELPITLVEGSGGTVHYSSADGSIGSHGALDEVRVYNRVLSSNDITELLQRTTDALGQTIQTASTYSFSLEQNTETTSSIQLFNPGNEDQIVSLEILNAHSELDFAFQSQEPITINSNSLQTVSVVIDAINTPVGAYDALLKISTENGETLYSNLNITIAEPGTQNQPDLRISSQDIQLTDYTLGDTATLQAVVSNQGTTAVSDVTVQFYEFGALLGETTLTEIAAQGTGTATITIPIGTSEGDHLIQVVVDSSDSVSELDETNNAASKIVTWGTPSVNAGNILVTGSSPSTVYAGDIFTVSGKAVYDVYVDGTRYTNYVVKGGSVQITIRDDAGNEWNYGGIHTDTNGNFNKYLQAPLILDKYQLSMTVSDKTFSGTRELVFEVVEEPESPQEPPAPPTITGTGYWTYTPSGASSVSGTWTWIWTSSPVNEPVTQTDLRIFSENIYFSNDNPDPEEDITIFAEINYWSTRTDITAEDVPVNLYATYPGSDKEKIGSTVISSLSAGSPNFGSQYIYGTWKNQDHGIYFIEVEIDPSFTEENMLNNAATRAVIVGALESNQGVIQGQVTNAWGGVDGVTIELYDEAGTTLISSTLTASTGHYCFESLPVGSYQVHIVTPDGYETETDTRPAEVLDQEITVVDFYLTQVENELCGDLDGDGDVDSTDRNILRTAFGTVEGDDGFVAEADYDLDGNIDYSDYQLWYYCYKQYVAGL